MLRVHVETQESGKVILAVTGASRVPAVSRYSLAINTSWFAQWSVNPSNHNPPTFLSWEASPQSAAHGTSTTCITKVLTNISCCFWQSCPSRPPHQTHPDIVVVGKSEKLCPWTSHTMLPSAFSPIFCLYFLIVLLWITSRPSLKV